MMTGYIRNGHMVVSSCFTTAPFSELKAGHLEGIQGMYADNCKCRVSLMLKTEHVSKLNAEFCKCRVSLTLISVSVEEA